MSKIMINRSDLELLRSFIELDDNNKALDLIEKMFSETSLELR